MRHPPDVLLAIAAGGAIGTPLRYEISYLLPRGADSFPWSTFLCDVTGAFVLGLFFALAVGRLRQVRYLSPFFAVGLVGSFTTFSTLAVETSTLVKDGYVVLGLGYLAATVVAGVAVAFAGFAAGRRAVRTA